MSTSEAPPGEAVTEAAARSGNPDSYKWIALSNTTIGILMVTISGSITIISLPDIFRGIKLNPLSSGNTSYLLWLLMGFLLVTAVLVVSFGRIGDMYGRVRMYNLGFAVFTFFSILLSVTWMTGAAGALWLIIMRIFQGVGGAFLFANSSAILTDAFPENERGLALGINSVAAIAGSFLGLLIGGLLAPINWRLVFLVSVPFGLFGTVWAYYKLVDTGRRTAATHRLGRQHHLRRRPHLAPGRDRLRDPALRRPHHGLDQPRRAGRHRRWHRHPDRLRGDRDPGRRIPCSACTCSRSGPSPPATSPTSSVRSAAAACSSC